MTNGIKLGTARRLLPVAPPAPTAAFRLLVVGDGYNLADNTAAAGDATRFEQHCQRLITAVLAEPWYQEIVDLNAETQFAIYAVDVVSAERGVSYEPTGGAIGPLCQTHFHTAYTTDGGSNWWLMLMPPPAGQPEPIAEVRQAVEQHEGVQFDAVAVITNSAAYGAITAPDMSYILSAGAGPLPEAVGLFLHEFGHLLGLEEEYQIGPGTSLHPSAKMSAPNLEEEDNNLRNIKWAPAVTVPASKLPCLTKTGNFKAGVTALDVGTFPGALYYTNAYRPKVNCRMRQPVVPFCEVCSAHLVVQLTY